MSSLCKFYGDLTVLDSILDIELELSDVDLVFAVEITEMPYTMVYTPSSDKVREIAQNLDGLQGVEEADAFVLFFERTVLGSLDTGIKAALTIKHGGDIQGVAKDPELGENFGAFLQIAYILNTFLSRSTLYQEYQSIDPETAGMLLSVNNGVIDATVVTGDVRPDMECRDTLSIQFLFASEKPIVTARPYADELKDALSGIGDELTE